MAIFDRFTKKASAKKVSAKKAGNVANIANEEKKSAVAAKSSVKEGARHQSGILLSHHITEKSSLGNKMNQYTFRVARRANKTEIKKAVEGKYEVRALRVNIVNAKGKSVRLGRIEGRVPGFKKAIVTLAEGQNIQMQ